jgi:predicted CXXCH cytochrome family protein
MNRHAPLIISLLCIAGFLAGRPVPAKTSVVDTKHNLSSSGPGQIKALTEDRICVFCHAPHNAYPRTPLWNKKIEGVNYTLYTPYTSSTMLSPPSPVGPTGATRLCLSCHDGTIALGEVLQPSGRIPMTVASGMPAGSPSYFGTSLERHHPVSISYFQALPNPELYPSPPAGLLFYGSGIMECTTCHDPHDNSNKKFLRASNLRSGLCTMCHAMHGWEQSPHNTSQLAWNLSPPNPWPRTGTGTDFGWETVQQNGCENCHAPHGAGGPKRLLNTLEEEKNCYPCHNGNVAAKNVQAQFQKVSRHQVDATTIGVTANHHEANESPLRLMNHVECADCHNAHAANGQRAAAPPAVPGSLQAVSGVDINGAAIIPPNASANEYEICFKCHANSSAQTIFQPIPRPAKDLNTRLAFQTANPSYHPVAGMGKNPDVPSIPSAYEPTLSTTSMIYCTDCHDSDESRTIGGMGPRGPHGSRYAPLLRERYETLDNTLESASVYALCYRCHNRTSILGDETFRKNLAALRGGHSGHLVGGPTGTAVNAPCSACHDPHGVRDDGLQSGSHTHLINFDLRYVSALPGSGYNFPIFTDNGSRAGSCTLVCHGVQHRAATHRYP